MSFEIVSAFEWRFITFMASSKKFVNLEWRSQSTLSYILGNNTSRVWVDHHHHDRPQDQHHHGQRPRPPPRRRQDRGVGKPTEVQIKQYTIIVIHTYKGHVSYICQKYFTYHIVQKCISDWLTKGFSAVTPANNDPTAPAVCFWHFLEGKYPSINTRPLNINTRQP